MDNPQAGDIISAYERFGVDLPDDLICPTLHDVELYYWGAFWELSTERQASMHGALPIPISAIRQYGGQDADFYAIIRAMDSAYLGHKKTFDRHTMRGG